MIGPTFLAFENISEPTTSILLAGGHLDCPTQSLMRFSVTSCPIRVLIG